MIKTLLFTAGLFGAAALPTAAQTQDDAASLAIDVTNIRGSQGRIIMAVYGDPTSYANLDESAAYAVMVVRPNEGALRVKLDTMQPGQYAVTLFHDANNNGAFDMKDDMPLEGYGVSGAKHALDEPNFRQARVAVQAGEQSITVKMHYFKL